MARRPGGDHRRTPGQRPWLPVDPDQARPAPPWPPARQARPRPRGRPHPPCRPPHPRQPAAWAPRFAPEPSATTVPPGERAPRMTARTARCRRKETAMSDPGGLLFRAARPGGRAPSPACTPLGPGRRATRGTGGQASASVRAASDALSALSREAGQSGTGLVGGVGGALAEQLPETPRLPGRRGRGCAGPYHPAKNQRLASRPGNGGSGGAPPGELAGRELARGLLPADADDDAYARLTPTRTATGISDGPPGHVRP